MAVWELNCKKKKMLLPHSLDLQPSFIQRLLFLQNLKEFKLSSVSYPPIIGVPSDWRGLNAPFHPVTAHQRVKSVWRNGICTQMCDDTIQCVVFRSRAKLLWHGRLAGWESPGSHDPCKLSDNQTFCSFNVRSFFQQCARLTGNQCTRCNFILLTFQIILVRHKKKKGESKKEMKEDTKAIMRFENYILHNVFLSALFNWFSAHTIA